MENKPKQKKETMSTNGGFDSIQVDLKLTKTICNWEKPDKPSDKDNKLISVNAVAWNPCP